MSQKSIRNLSLAGLVAAMMMILGAGSPVAAEGNSVYEGLVVQPLGIEDCARCHSSHFNWLRERGAKHQGVVCTDCHTVFHAYNPLRNNYAQIMPQCSSCHDAPHGSGEQVQGCLNCHTNPHMPLNSIPVPADLEDRCRICHAPIAQLLTGAPSKHTEQPCSSCHSEKHGRIPQCSECHESHSPMAALATPECLACHPVHTPLAINYPVTQVKEVCAGCHQTAFSLLADRLTKHSELTCAKCHPKHGHLPACQDCHGQPHGAAIHEKYTACGSCHGIAHDVQK